MTNSTIIDVPDIILSSEARTSIVKGALESTKEDLLKQFAYSHKKETKQTDEGLIEVFSDDQLVVVQKLNDYWEEAAVLYTKMLETRNVIDQVQADSFSKWFFVNAEKYKEGVQLKEVYGHIKRLRRIKVAYEKKQVEGLMRFAKFETKMEARQYNTDTMMDREGLLIDIAMYDGMKLRGTSSRFQGICPFHQETTPSFFIYSDNWYHCFGCQKHGNVFNYVMLTRSVDFKTALAEVDKFM